MSEEKMQAEEQARIDIDGMSVRMSGDKHEEVDVGPGHVHVKDGDSEITVTWTGIRVRDGKNVLKISIWKPIIAIAVGAVLLAALLTVLVAGIIKLMF
jgi:hypothetical protein